MTIKQVLQNGYKKLHKNHITSPHLDAEVILSFVLKKPKEFLYTYPEQEINKTINQKINSLIEKRAKHYPVAYITNNKEFFGLDFFVNEDVLIPRPETELLVEECLRCIWKQRAAKSHPDVRNGRDRSLHLGTYLGLHVAEIGTGSGCISISLAKNSKAKIIATDISAAALKVAKRNARKHKVLSKIKFYQGNLLEPIKNKKIDILVANLPYLDTNYKNLLNSSDKKALRFEPSLALYSGKEGLDHYAEFFEQVAELKHKPKLILVEFGPKQTSALKKIIHQHLNNNLKLVKVQPGTLMIELT
ncbi:peptide chain release factor N(5)-glutamine methyltransferase [Candidatus Kuenenbacteria bacterium]|nr:peptide chain release factor N(5)-glutamine methyltransferase [Candidatus Kuenenbacteria bacterium]